MHRVRRSLVALAGAACLALPVAGPALGDAVDIDLAPARAGLAAFLHDHRPATPTAYNDAPGCPAIELDRMQGALAGAGMRGELADWGTEIEWGEYAAIDPDLIGLVCSGDADGDANDRDFGLYASVRVIDAGHEDQAQEVLQALGYGALEGDVGDVPGGELFATCLDEDAVGSLCLSYWSLDGLVVGATVVSSDRDVPAGTATAVLEDVLGDVLATLADYEPAHEPAGADAPTPTPGTGADSAPPAGAGEGGLLAVDAARAGLAARLAPVGQIGELEPLEDCPVVERDAVVDALERAGVDTPIESLFAEQGPTLTNGGRWQATGLLCTGVYVGAEGDRSFPELRIAVLVADFGDADGFAAYLADIHPDLDVDDGLPVPALGSATIGQCADVDRTDQCAEYWEQDGFVVGIRVADRIYIDRPTASAVLGSLVPTIVQTLAAAG